MKKIYFIVCLLIVLNFIFYSCYSQDKTNSIDNVRNISNLYLKYDYWGASLRGSHAYHDSLYNLIALEEVSIPTICIIDTFKINNIILKNDNNYLVTIKFNKIMCINEILTIEDMDSTYIDSFIVQDGLIVKPPSAHYINYNVYLEYLHSIIGDNISLTEGKYLKISNIIRNKFNP